MGCIFPAKYARRATHRATLLCGSIIKQIIFWRAKGTRVIRQLHGSLQSALLMSTRRSV